MDTNNAILHRNLVLKYGLDKFLVNKELMNDWRSLIIPETVVLNKRLKSGRRNKSLQYREALYLSTANQLLLNRLLQEIRINVTNNGDKMHMHAGRARTKIDLILFV